MENLKLSSKTILLFTVLLLLFIGCTPDTPSEPSVELNFNDVTIEAPFTLKEHCGETYDSIFIVQPYFDTNKEVFTNICMSNGLKSVCSINTASETISTILFIKDNRVEAYTVVERYKADFVTRELEKKYIFPIDQRFIMDKGRNIHIYNELHLSL